MPHFLPNPRLISDNLFHLMRPSNIYTHIHTVLTAIQIEREKKRSNTPTGYFLLYHQLQLVAI